jgi:transcriptional regulator with XRE-family HTH domain
MSKAGLLEKLTNKQYRDALVSEEIDVGLPMQLREMRESRGWKQSEVAQKIGTSQPRFPVMEKPGYGNFSLTTLKKLASVFDVGLIVSFVPFSEMIDFRESISRKRLAIPGFCDEYLALERRYSRSVKPGTNTIQGTFEFPSATLVYETTAATIAPVSEVGQDHPDVAPEPMTIHPVILYVPQGGSTATYARSR